QCGADGETEALLPSETFAEPLDESTAGRVVDRRGVALDRGDRGVEPPVGHDDLVGHRLDDRPERAGEGLDLIEFGEVDVELRPTPGPALPGLRSWGLWRGCVHCHCLRKVSGRYAPERAGRGPCAARGRTAEQGFYTRKGQEGVRRPAWRTAEAILRPAPMTLRHRAPTCTPGQVTNSDTIRARTARKSTTSARLSSIRASRSESPLTF